MTRKGLDSFIDLLDKKGELLRISQFVNPVLEITEITDRISKSNNNKAILFEDTGTRYPLLINMFGSINRINLALGADKLETISEEIEQLIQFLAKPKNTFLDKFKALPFLKKISDWMPSVQKRKGFCQEIINKDPDLHELPVLNCWPLDGGRFITLPMVITKDPESGNRNVGMYRMQILSKNETAMHWQKYKTGRNHFEKYKNLNQKMPVAVAIGGDPIYTYSATAPLPENIDEFILAGFLRKEKVKLVKCITQDIEVPADVDIVIEGYIDPSENLVMEGPFGDHTGFYSLADWYPKFHVTCITHKFNAVYPATIVGVPPMEDAWLAKATERIFLPPVRLSLSPEITDMVLPFQGVAHNIAIVKIKTGFKGQASKVMHALWGAGQMAFNKILFIVSENVDISNFKDVAKAISKFCDPVNDIFISRGILDELDHACDEQCFGGKICFDATEKEAENETTINMNNLNDWKTSLINEYDDITDININLFNEDIRISFISVKKKHSINQLIKQIVLRTNGSGIKFLVFVENTVDLNNLSLLGWITSANIDAQRDCKLDKETGILTIDATRKIYRDDKFKREWPNIVVMDEQTIVDINKKWVNFNIGEFIESPSLRYACLNSNAGVTAKKEDV